jgi:hypothetical protein
MQSVRSLFHFQHFVDASGFRMAVFKRQFKLDPEDQQEAAGNRHGKTNQVYQGINPVFQDIPQGYFQIMQYHIQ